MGQSLSDIVIHIVFSTKDRHPFIKSPIDEELYKYLSTVCNNLKCPILAINGVEDHLHILLRLGKTITTSHLISEIKSNSSRWIKTKDRHLNNFSWQNGYGAFSVARPNIQKAVNYVVNQKERHKKQTFKEELLWMLQLSEMSYDEKYLWD